MPPELTPQTRAHLTELSTLLPDWARNLGFDQIGVADTNIDDHSARLSNWLAEGFHGEMAYMAKQAHLRANPGSLHAATQRVISVRMDYSPAGAPPRLTNANTVIASDRADAAYTARYALGRDYHKVLRKRLATLQGQIENWVYERGIAVPGGRVFTDSAPVLERGFAEKAGLGWIGKNTMLINRNAGSYFFLGELFTALPLATTAATSNHCGSCSACIEVCPTGAIVAPYQLDARRCISYFTIELKGAIPIEYRRAMGNRIFGCDDCQIVCPWNRYAKVTTIDDFLPRNQLDTSSMLALFAWSEEAFLARTAGSAIRRTGYDGWLRNLAVALGNAPTGADVVAALARRKGRSDLIDEHIDWALAEHAERKSS
jgi:epoxyqueuosine reductase